MEDLTYRRIRNYLRRQISNDHENNLINRLLCLFYSNINGIPLMKEINEEEFKVAISAFPSYFKDLDKKTIIEIFNKEVNYRKPIKVDWSISKYCYDITKENSLKVSTKTFRPFFDNNWKEKAEEINNTPIENQQSFYADYLRYYLRFRRFPIFEEFLIYIYKKYNRPVHKDIKNAFVNINESYEPIMDFIVANNLTFKEVKEIIIKTTKIENRIKLQE